MKNHPLGRGLTVLALVFVTLTSTVWAHKEDYIDETLVYLTLDQGEFEPEYWFDYGHRSDSGLDFMRHNLSAEYGITDHWMLDGRATMQKEEGMAFEFDSARLETRYRFGGEGENFVDTAISGEANVEREDGVDRFGLEPRLILSKDFHQLNFTVNFSEEIPFDSRRYAFQVSSGFRYDATERIQFGSELKYDVNNHEAAVIPQIWFAFPHEVTLKAGYSHGFDHNKEDFLRLVVEIGL